MYILGINAYYHDTSACIMKDGKVIALAEEERFIRIKHANHTFPYNAIEYCLKHAGIKLQDIDHIAYYINQDLIIKNIWKFQPYFNKLICKPWKLFGALYIFKQNDKEVEKIGKIANAKVHFIEHHVAHASSAFFGSDFKRANILTLDGRGELITSFHGIGNGTEIMKLGDVPLPHSLGMTYSSITDFLNFKPNDGEGKVMGLAPYGQDKFKDQFDKIIWQTKDGFKTNPKYIWGLINEWGREKTRWYTQDTIELLGKPRTIEEPINNHYEHIAHSLQKKTEDIGIHMSRLLFDKTNCKNICIAGGIALNAKMNGLIGQQSFIENIYIQPAASDSGAAVGAAMFVYSKLTGKRPDPIEHVFLGPEYSNEYIKKILDKCKIKYDFYDDITGITAELLSKNKIIGWFQGRMEAGPRALGCRSILVNPSDKEMIFKVNYYVKNRELWRPFSLSMLYNDRNKYLVHGFKSPFMILIDEVPEKIRNEVIAGVHVDGTTRPQTLEEKHNPLYYKLIQNFGKMTGIPVLLNTSFNLAGEPIVNKPEEAIKDFFGSGMDYLAIGNFLISK